uniref:WH2 domain-containing protein n=1 Tax=Panagrolaimus superbus TaxID=310955 RepID=A0A914YG31_9BILA
MKRRKQRGMPSPSLQSNTGISQAQMHGLPRTPDSSSNPNNHYYATQQMKSSFSNSSPDLHQHSRKPSIDSQMTDYSKPQRILRPKTPPPPPPPMPHQNLNHHQQQQQHQQQIHQQQQQEIYGSVREVVVENAYGQATAAAPAPPLSESSIAAVRTAPPPPPPPPPPPNFLKSSTPLKLESNKSAPKTTSELPNGNGAITAEALTSVRLKPVQSSDSNNNNSNNNNITSKPANPGPKKSLDFDADLRNALAKRRSKVGVEETDHISSKSGGGIGTIVKDTKVTTETTVVGRYGGLSLRESVRENVQVPVIGVTGGKQPPQHSPPNFANKKDSG